MRRVAYLFLTMTILTCTACAPVVAPPQWNHEPEAVRIHIKADHRLNMYNGRAHTLYMCTYQLRELDALDRMTQDSDGIQQLLECRLFDDSVASANSRVVHPGEQITLTMDRASRVKHLAIVTGYSTELSNERVVRRHNFQTYKQTESYLKRQYRCIPCELNIELALGPYQIEHSKIMPSDQVCNDECE